MKILTFAGQEHATETCKGILTQLEQALKDTNSAETTGTSLSESAILTCLTEMANGDRELRLEILSVLVKVNS